MTRLCKLCARTRLAHVEAGESLRFFVEDLNMLDIGAPRPVVHELNETLDSLFISFEDGFDAPIPAIRHPSRH